MTSGGAERLSSGLIQKVFRLVSVVAVVAASAGCPSRSPVQEPQGQPQIANLDPDAAETLRKLRSIPSLQSAVTRLLDRELAGQSEQYKAAALRVFSHQVVFCDGRGQLNRVEVKWSMGKNRELGVSLYSPGRYDLGDTHPNAITLRDGVVVGITFGVESYFDSCCTDWEHLEHFDDDFLDTIARIETLESIDLSGCGITDAGLRVLARLKNLRSVDLEQTAITCEGLQHLNTLEHLQTLRHSCQDIKENLPPSACHLVAQHKDLRELYLGSIELDREGLRAIGSCAALETVNLEGKLLEANAFQLLQGNGGLKSMTVYVTSDGDASIDLRKMLRLTDLQFWIQGGSVEVVLEDLPELRKLMLSLDRSFPKAANSGEAAIDTDEKGRPPHVLLNRLPSLETATVSLRDSRFDSTSKHGAVRLGELPMLGELHFGELDGALQVDCRLPNLKRLGGHLRFLADIYQAMSNFPNLEELEGPGAADHAPHTRVTVEQIAPVFELANLRKLEISGVDGGRLTFEPFRKLPRLRELTLRFCQIAESFEVTGHPELVDLRFWRSASRRILVRDAPKLERFGIVVSSAFESAEFIQCPSLQSWWCQDTPNLTHPDLRQANLRSPGNLDTVMGFEKDKDDVLLLPGE